MYRTFMFLIGRGEKKKHKNINTSGIGKKLLKNILHKNGKFCFKKRTLTLKINK